MTDPNVPASSAREQVFDVVIVGGGPAGQSAALILGRACRSVAVVDAGHPRNAAARHFHGYLGRDSTDPKALARDGRGELARYGVKLFDDFVIRAEPTHATEGDMAGGFLVKTQAGRTLTGRKLLFATGVEDELPDLPGVRECYGATIHHCPYCDGWEHRGQHLLAYGNDAQKAVGLGLSLKTWSDRVTVLTHGQSASEEEQRRLAACEIGLVEDRVLQIVHSGDRLTGVELEDGSVVEADAMFFNTGQRPACDLPRLLGCEMKDAESVRSHGKQATNLRGVFVAGDADDDVQFVILAAAEGARAAVAINAELQEEDRAVAAPSNALL